MDSAGACQLHGFPGIFGALAAAVVVVATTDNQLVSADLESYFYHFDCIQLQSTLLKYEC